MDCFKVLKIESTTDKTLIKRAYNRAWGEVLGDHEQTRILNEAYELALLYADGKDVNTEIVSPETDAPTETEVEDLTKPIWPHHEQPKENQLPVQNIEASPTLLFENSPIESPNDNASTINNNEEFHVEQKQLENDIVADKRWDVAASPIELEPVETVVKPKENFDPNTNIPAKKFKAHPIQWAFSIIAITVFFVIQISIREPEPPRQQQIPNFDHLRPSEAVNPNDLTQEELDALIYDLLEELGALGTRDEEFELLYDTVWERLIDIEMVLVYSDIWIDDPDLSDTIGDQMIWILNVFADYGRNLSVDDLEYLLGDLEHMYEQISHFEVR